MKPYVYTFLLLTIFTFYQCQTRKPQSTTSTFKPSPVDLNSSPVVPANESISKMKVEEGFEVRLVASEPLISTPVAMSFDEKGRMWVVEMLGYMPDSLGRGEELPTGKIVILDDDNKDGVADRRTVFLDSLVLPRAICLIDDGILVAEPPRLWYYDIRDGKPVNKVLVDDKYAVGGNVEHQPNGLLRAMDNWIYNAKSDKRYRKIKGEWVIQNTHFRGQWGITQDNHGRLYYNDNSTNLVGDYFSPGFGATNINQRDVAGYTERTVADNRVYPIRPTPGVNRGYSKGTLDDGLRLTNFTAACGPLIYRSDLFGDAYKFNAFVAEPSANLIKRNVLSENGFVVKGSQAYKGSEFLASLDERFRPVNLHSGPDGALYVLDMYRGIIQHKTYVTPYLSEQFKRRDLSGPLNCGRIYKIVPNNKKASPVTFPDDARQLVALLGHTSGYVRDMAQQLLIDRRDRAAIPYLQQAIHNQANPMQIIHAMWVLEGLSALQTNQVLALLKSEQWPVRMQALTVLPSMINSSSSSYYVQSLRQILDNNDELAAPYLAFLAYYIKPFDEVAANDILLSLVKKYPDNRFVADAVISTQGYREQVFEQTIAKFVPDTSLRIRKQLSSVISRFKNTQKNRDPQLLAKQYPKGALLYQSSCQTCHAPDGNGIQSLAPPLNKSQWVTGNKNNLIAIVLYGLTGPVNVNGRLYKAPEISGDMPGIGHSEEISDEDIAQVLSFIRGSWQNDSGKVETTEIATVRSKYKGRATAFTEEELLGNK
jgi:mono/diheme cytochrome c family protein